MDMRKLDQLEQFSAFIEFLTKPEEYKTLLIDLKETAKVYKKEADNIRETKTFQEWRNSETDSLEKRDKVLLSKTDKLEKDKSEFEVEKQKAKDKLLLEAAIVEKLKVEAATKLTELDYIQQAKKDMIGEREVIANAKIKLQEDTEAFEKRVSAFTALLKG